MMIFAEQGKNLLEILIRPRHFFKNLGSLEKQNWLFPLLVVTLAAVYAMAATAVARYASLGEIPYPEGFQYYLPEEQERYRLAISIERGPLFLFFFPAIGKSIGIWTYWLLMSAFLGFLGKIGRSKMSGVTLRNMVGWAMLPLALRFLLQGTAIFITKQLVSQSGFSFIFQQPPLFSPYLAGLAQMVDFYYLWHVLLLLIGSIILWGVPAWRSVPLTLLAVFLWLNLSSGWSALMAQLNQIIGI